MNRLVLIDGNAMMHRAYHALPPMRTADGQPGHVVYGFISMIFRLYQDLKPTHVAVAFDRPGPTFRNTLYKEYQSQRPQMEDDFISQIALVHDAATAFGIPIYEADGFEADDVIGTVCKQVTVNSQKIDQVVIVTGDRDILQLVVDDKVLCYMPTKGLSEGKLYGEKDVVERLGVEPDKIPLFKALAGDASDNYPGVPGIGPKTAVTLVHKYGSLKKIYQHAKEEKAAAKLFAGEKSAKLSEELATIRKDAPITFDAKYAALKTLNSSAARAKLEELHFPSLLKRLAGFSGDIPKRFVVQDQPKKDPTEQQQLF